MKSQLLADGFRERLQEESPYVSYTISLARLCAFIVRTGAGLASVSIRPLRERERSFLFQHTGHSVSGEPGNDVGRAGSAGCR